MRTYYEAQAQVAQRPVIIQTVVNTTWKLETLTLTDLQKAELDECYDDMLRFVKENS